ncbi:MAG: gamma-glutamylcyclotransferase [Nitrospirota bacterium]|nr:MAG: gamma-glutamylcyclotransferase [Nitrospirota bacterium]
MLYFAYGSNMSERRLRERVPSAQKVGVATLPGHQLVFHKKSENDGSGKCNAYPTLVLDEVVIGILFDLDRSEKILLDGAEGIGVGYEQRTVGLSLDNGSSYEAFAYFAICIDPSLKPYHWYKEHVLRGAVENSLPESYISSIQCVESIDDPNSKRAVQELSIYW